MLDLGKRGGHFPGMTDEDWMTLALGEARKGVGRSAPNPPVGAVVMRDGKFLGAGWHRRAGMPHAEVEAMAAAEREHGIGCLAGATVYVTLEPCSTAGKTPACTGGLVRAGVARVVYGCMDPNPAHAGAAGTILRVAGIEVRAGVLEKECGEILRPFAKVQRTGLPWVIWKCAMSLDGRITRPEGEGRWLSGAESRADVQRLRAEVDAILTSGETVRRDKPTLTIRIPELLEGRSQPWRVVLTDMPDSLPGDAPLFSDEWKDRTILRGRDDLEGTLRELARERGVLSVMLEAGGKLSAAMFAAGLVDEAVIYHAPLLCGGGTLPAMAGQGFPASVQLRDVTWERFGADLRVRGLIAK
jgi:diaminohydroxyphosphoribosylaminopyrimidine deaminase / 5-amino-6-(5-phosphoribosylamino)uracil reductase